MAHACIHNPHTCMQYAYMHARMLRMEVWGHAAKTHSSEINFINICYNNTWQTCCSTFEKN